MNSKISSLTKPMPIIFFGHGNPMNALNDNNYTREWARSLEWLPCKPQAIVCISAHWETEGTRITSGNAIQKTIHDMYGFPPDLYAIRYSPSGDEKLVKRIRELLPDAQPDNSWGLDHGTWCILRHIFPNADVPVIQLSIDMKKNLQQHFALAQKLSPLRNENILIIGSGNIVHNIRRMDWSKEGSGYPWAIEFNNTIKEAISNRNYQLIMNYKQINGGKESVPTEEHFIPLIYVLALQKSDESAKFFTDSLDLGSFSMTSVLIN